MQYKETFAFLPQGTNVMANEQRRKIVSFGGMKFKYLQRDREHDRGRI